ncbi:MAG: nuclear transport factor 2 family protein [Chitinophagaceae bacterium]|nr:nuclear transport factor 2 family protein [Chitinophagaceae bacterium]
MKLTKQLEAKILKLYHGYWNANINGDIKAFISYIDDNIIAYGTAKAEVFKSKKAIAKFYKATADQMKDKADFRNRKINVKAVGNTVVVSEECDLYVLAGKAWIFYGHTRVTSVFAHKRGSWKVVHNHASFPDSRAEEGEQIATQKIKTENLQLKEAVQRRTVELETKNKELQIEAALERVRTVAMSMKKADDMLTICKTISQQLAKLGVKEIRNVQTAVIRKEKGTYINYEFYAKHNKLLTTEVSYTDHAMTKAFINKMLDGPNEFFTRSLKGKKVQEWYAFQKKSTKQFPDHYLLKATSLSYYWYSLGPIALGVSTYAPLSKEEQALIVRFRNVFELSYRRFLDIEKATAQAREAQIEAALERVRAAAMAMRNSTELSNIIDKLYGELTKLDAKLDRCFIMIVNPENKGITWWLAGKEGLLEENGFFIQDNQHPTHVMYLDNWKKRKKKWQYNFEGKEKKDWDKFGFSKTELSRLPEFIKKDMSAVKKIHLSGSSDQFGSLVTGSLEPLPEEQQEIISRFTIAFNQAYIRFLDLQKAEANARETAIELGLERVRARAMAMQHSDELAELVATVFTELNKLEFSLASCIIWIHGPADKSNALWIASDEMNKPARPLQIVPFYEPFFRSIIAAWKAKDPKWIFSLTGAEKKKFQTLFFKHYPELPEALRKPVSQNKQITFSASFNNFGALEVVGTEPLTDEKFNILHRFGNVFNSSYTRFHDLQKAEAQAREAQIQLALERVRARTMAMQKSEELPGAATLLFNQIQSLGMPAFAAGYCIWEKDKQAITLWMSSEGVLQPPFEAPTTEDELFIQMRKGYEQGKLLHVVEMGGEDLVTHYKYMRTLPVVGKIFDSLLEAGHPLPVFQVMHQAYFSKGFLLFITYEPVPSAHDIFIRFANVFDQTYTRFLDLQKAEAQAREAQIEAALEKVRSRSMAMQQPEELIEVAELLRKEMGLLGVEELETSSIYIIDKEKKKTECWYAIKDVRKENAQLISDEMTLILTDTWVGKEMWKFYQSSNDRVSILMKGERRREWINYCAQHSKVLQGYYGDEIPERTYHLVKFNGGYMGAASPGAISKESWDLLKRAAVVFSLAYTRFKDLQDAAARAREAQIELALERVRARSLAMHKSDELKEVIKVVLEQFVHLNINAEHAGFYIDYKTHDDMHIWLADPNIEPFFAILPYFDTPTWNSFLEAKAKARLSGGQGTTLHTDLLDFKTKNKFYKSLFKIFKVPEEAQHFYLKCKGLAVSTVLLDNVGLYIENFSAIPYTDEENAVLLRMGKVFQQTYTRFLDLQKAEAQAREAQIETALERVRSRTLAMQKSEELAETAAEVFRQLIALGIEPNRLYIGVVNGDTKDMEMWATDEDGSGVGKKFTFNAGDNGSVKKLYDGWASKMKSVTVDMQGAELEDYINYLKQLNIPLSHALTQKRRVQSVAYFDKGFIGMASPDEQSEKNIHLLERFAAVFNLTFTRFNDLQIAEAHARQAEQDLIAIKEAKQKAEEALTELQSTQKQLIQSEKMASLGELTAGIAHEIQNPLNFVNNFSEVSKELIKELVEEAEKGNTGEVKLLADDLIGNLQKIHHHGERAASIVKGMLQHSRSSSSQKELTDINALCDEYLRLAYHGLRAKDKSFNASFTSEFDENIGSINIVPQDMGRVILNLINNAFYAVNEKKNSATDYTPSVRIKTVRKENAVLISITDNGKGIPSAIREKIFQPFFTTKPTGVGTGLGLSLSYDIIKAHGGELKVQSTEARPDDPDGRGHGTTFTIQLPL